MILSILRAIFVFLVTCVALLYLLNSQRGLQFQFVQFASVALIAIGLALFVLVIDASTPHKKLSAISGVFLGLAAGMLVAYALSYVVDLAGVLTTDYVSGIDSAMTDEAKKEAAAAAEAYRNLLQGVKVLIGLITCYLGISLVLQTKDDFRFVIPYVEFAKQVRGIRPILLDTSVLIDGRIVDIVNTKLLQAPLMVPKFVLKELQAVADSADRLKRTRGRRGMEVLQKLQSQALVRVSIEEVGGEGEGVDLKLMSVAQSMPARLMTTDYNLTKIAELRGVEVINLHQLAGAMKPVLLPGETMTLSINRAGEGAGQGVGYLEDGTMVVVEGARQMIGQLLDVQVTRTLQTTGGQMIFARIASLTPAPQDSIPAATDRIEIPRSG